MPRCSRVHCAVTKQYTYGVSPTQSEVENTEFRIVTSPKSWISGPPSASSAGAVADFRMSPQLNIEAFGGVPINFQGSLPESGGGSAPSESWVLKAYARKKRARKRRFDHRKNFDGLLPGSSTRGLRILIGFDGFDPQRKI